jgi:hypothetical protein
MKPDGPYLRLIGDFAVGDQGRPQGHSMRRVAYDMAVSVSVSVSEDGREDGRGPERWWGGLRGSNP